MVTLFSFSPDLVKSLECTSLSLTMACFCCAFSIYRLLWLMTARRKDANRKSLPIKMLLSNTQQSLLLAWVVAYSTSTCSRILSGSQHASYGLRFFVFQRREANYQLRSVASMCNTDKNWATSTAARRLSVLSLQLKICCFRSRRLKDYHFMSIRR